MDSFLKQGGGDESGVSFQGLHLERFINQFEDNGEVQWVILGLVNTLVDVFSKQNPEAIKKIASDKAFQDKRTVYDNTSNYIAEGVFQTLGFSPSV